MFSTRSLRIIHFVSLLFLLPLMPSLLHAAESQDNASSSGFSLHAPRIFIGGHMGYSFPRADSDIFDFVTRELTLQKSDFRATTFGGDFGIPIRSHFAVVLSFEYSRATAQSESRNFLEDNGDPITQTTRLTQVPITATVRYYPRKLGETAGSYAWIPTRINPYVGGGLGVLHYSFSQFGRFVDAQNLSIFADSFTSDGFAATEHVVAGVDISLSPLIFLNTEGRYSWASADLSNNFTGFHPIDLSGVRLQGGIYFRF